MPDGSRLPPWTPRVLPEAQAAHYVGLGLTTFRQVVRPVVPPVRLSEGRIGWRRDDLDRWVDARPLVRDDATVDPPATPGEAAPSEGLANAPDYFSDHVFDALPPRRRARRHPSQG